MDTTGPQHPQKLLSSEMDEISLEDESGESMVYEYEVPHDIYNILCLPCDNDWEPDTLEEIDLFFTPLDDNKPTPHDLNDAPKNVKDFEVASPEGIPAPWLTMSAEDKDTKSKEDLRVQTHQMPKAEQSLNFTFESNHIKLPPPPLFFHLTESVYLNQIKAVENTSQSKHKLKSSSTLLTSPCTTCKQPFKTNQYNQDQRTFCHPVFFGKTEEFEDDTRSPSQKKCHQCPKCPQQFTFKTGLHRHLFSHMDSSTQGEIMKGWKHECNVCHRKFRFPSLLQLHMPTHSDDRRFNCEKCTKTFKIKTELYRHRRTHIEGHGFKCYFCNTGFTAMSGLKEHLVTHTREKPFRCSHSISNCRKVFGTKSKLNLHVKGVHKNIRPHACFQCTQAFTQKGDLTRHVRRVHPIQFTILPMPIQNL